MPTQVDLAQFGHMVTCLGPFKGLKRLKNGGNIMQYMYLSGDKANSVSN